MSEEALARFAAAAEEYCCWTEAKAAEPRAEMIRAQALLADLLYWILKLPPSDWQAAKPNRREGVTVSEPTEASLEAHGRRYAIAAERFKTLPAQVYWLVFDPLDEPDKEPVCGTLADDLADIYCDLFDGLELYRAGDPEGAVWEWRFNFDIHWANHLFEAQRVIHSYLQSS